MVELTSFYQHFFHFVSFKEFYNTWFQGFSATSLLKTSSG